MPKNHPELTAERLREVLSYNPDTGVFRWKVTRSRTVAGTAAGTNNVEGYIHIMLDKVTYRAHRLAWLHVHGEWPKDQLDHINGARDDNRIANLREATNAQNGQNRRVGLWKPSGCPGVHWHKQSRKWRAVIKSGGSYIHLGMFHELSDAVAARTKAKAIHHEFSPEQPTCRAEMRPGKRCNNPHCGLKE